MSLLVIPNVLVNGTGPANIVDAVGLNANFTAIATAVNNIYPSQILPITTGQATFGATATGVGYKFLANDATATPLTISGVTSQSVDILDVTLTSGGTKVVFVDSSGAFFAGGSTVGFEVSAAGVLTAWGGSASRELVVNSLGVIGLAIYSSNVSITAPSQPSSVSGGDITAQRTTTTGRYYMGGNATFGFMDFNILNAAQVSFQNNSGYADVSGGTYHTASDSALKTNIAPITGSLSKIAALTPVTFDMIATGKPGIGFTAQDVQAQFPDAVIADSEGTLAYSPVAVLAHLVQAFQDYVAAHP